MAPPHYFTYRGDATQDPARLGFTQGRGYYKRPLQAAPQVPQTAEGMPTMGAYAQPPQGSLAQIPQGDGQMQQIARQQQTAYAAGRLKQLGRVMQALPPELQATFAQQTSVPGYDPAAAWRAVSGAFAKFAMDKFHTDPRWVLQHGLPSMLAHQERGTIQGV